MRISVKCSAAVHVLLMIAMLPAEKKKTSEFLATSVGNNPVEVRKALSSLKKAGIIEVARGPGGASLAREPEAISLLDIYSAVDSASLDELIGVHGNPEPRCPFGRNIAQLLAKPYGEIGDAVREKMRQVTLRQLIEDIQQMEPELQ
mgnify:CR=1 FL=1